MKKYTENHGMYDIPLGGQYRHRFMPLFILFPPPQRQHSTSLPTQAICTSDCARSCVTWACNKHKSVFQYNTPTPSAAVSVHRFFYVLFYFYFDFVVVFYVVVHFCVLFTLLFTLLFAFLF